MLLIKDFGLAVRTVLCRLAGVILVWGMLSGTAVIAGGHGVEPIGDVVRGEKIFEKCKGCHQVGAGAVNRIGPHLNGVFGRRAAAIDGFFYSKAVQRAASDGLIWDLEQLDAYLENPKALISGTRMSFRGLKVEKDRQDVLAYLREFSDDPANIPEAEPTAILREVELSEETLAIVGDPEYGEYLSSECTTCHQRDGSDDGIPSITLWPVEDFVVAMHAYKRKIRAHPVMQMMAGRLDDEEIAALAAYFAKPE
jgi:cytochrome c